MIYLGNLVTGIKEINPIWTFSHYCKIPESHFNESTIKIKSLFNPDDKTPSFCIYYKNNKYAYKDFSTSRSGDHINLVQDLFDLNYSQSCIKIVKDYTQWALTSKAGLQQSVEIVKKYQVSGFKKREWNTDDRDFFLPFGIGSKRLAWGLVQPLEGYTMYNGSSELQISGSFLYGYFTRSGELYKIYQPKNKECKFLNVKNDYEVGSEHDEEGNEFAVILSSWKDAMCFKDLGMKIDIKVPSSENSFLSKEFIDGLKRKYKKVFTLFDADEAGKKAMLKYKELYDLDYVWLPLSKDISDSRRDHGKQKLLATMLPLIHKIIN